MILQVDCVMRQECIVMLSSGGGKRDRALWLEPERMSFMKEFIAPFSKGGQLVVDWYARRFSVKKLCMMLPKS